MLSGQQWPRSMACLDARLCRLKRSNNVQTPPPPLSPIYDTGWFFLFYHSLSLDFFHVFNVCLSSLPLLQHLIFLMGLDTIVARYHSVCGLDYLKIRLLQRLRSSQIKMLKNALLVIKFVLLKNSSIIWKTYYFYKSQQS